VDTSNAGGYGLSVRRGGVATLTNSILWGCGDGPINVTTQAELGSTVYVNYCNIENGMDSIRVSDSLSVLHWGTGNLSVNPQFVDFKNEDYRLSDTSPCIGAGINCFDLNDTTYCAPEFDIKGTTRPSPGGSNADMGAYEHDLGIPSAIEENSVLIPDRFRLRQNFPNPFNPSTKIQFDLPFAENVRLEIYNILGQRVSILLSERKQAGRHTLEWNASEFASGIYYYYVRAGEFYDIKKMILIR
jgi:hypothetical protein